jgi:hypothetical protein
MMIEVVEMRMDRVKRGIRREGAWNDEGSGRGCGEGKLWKKKRKRRRGSRKRRRRI